MIQLEHISKSFAGKSGAVDALKDVTIRVEKGDIYGIIGFSGAGKSTLIRMVNRLERPDTGAVRVDGRELSKLSTAQLRKLRRSIGMVFQQFNLLESNPYDSDFFAFLNLDQYAVLKHQCDGAITDRLSQLLNLLDLGG